MNTMAHVDDAEEPATGNGGIMVLRAKATEVTSKVRIMIISLV